MGSLLLAIGIFLLLIRGIATFIVLIIVCLSSGLIAGIGTAVLFWLATTIIAFGLSGLGAVLTKV